jgi:hypothetical protein
MVPMALRTPMRSDFAEFVMEGIAVDDDTELK